MVREMGGTIEATSEEGEGTEFSLVFPVVEERAHG
jgi:signal transduction histidine kinase